MGLCGQGEGVKEIRFLTAGMVESWNSCYCFPFSASVKRLHGESFLPHEGNHVLSLSLIQPPVRLAGWLRQSCAPSACPQQLAQGRKGGLWRDLIFCTGAITTHFSSVNKLDQTLFLFSWVMMACSCFLCLERVMATSLLALDLWLLL